MSEMNVENVNKVYAADAFDKLPEDEKNNEFIAMKSKTYFQDVWFQFKKNKLAVFGLVFLIIMIIFAVFGPMFSKYTYDGQDLANRNLLPCAEHWFGTDKFGRDLFVRVMYGGRISLAVGFAAAMINLCIGVVWGGICGYIFNKSYSLF